MRTKVLISGAAGFIGSHLARQLLSNNYEVSCIIKQDTDKYRIEDIKTKLHIFECDLVNYEQVNQVVDFCCPDVVVHLAAHYSVQHDSSQLGWIMGSNLLGTVNMLEASKDKSSSIFLNASTCFVYKQQSRPIAESDPLLPPNLYALTKINGEQACRFYSDNYGLRVINLRMFPLYGPDDNIRKLIPSVTESLLNGHRPKMSMGTQEWDYVYIDDLVEALCRLIVWSANHSAIGVETVNIGTGKTVQIKEIVNEIRRILETDVEPEWGTIPRRKNEIHHLCCDNGKMRQMIDWQPSTDILKDGIRLTVEQYIKNRK